MSDLSSRERRKLEQLLEMGGGYVLNFSNRTFSEFFREYVRKDIDNAKFETRGTSKANRLRAFWDLESNSVVARCLRELFEHAKQEGVLTKDAGLLANCVAIVERLEQHKPVADIDAIAALDDDRDFELVAKSAVESIEKDQPELGLDRLHTFVVKYVRKLLEDRGVSVDRSVPLNGLFGAYVKQLRTDRQLESEMTERILKSSIANLEHFNHVRNQQSLAHDNPVLSYDEALLIFNHVASTVRFVRALEDRLKAAALQKAKEQSQLDWDIPF